MEVLLSPTAVDNPWSFAEGIWARCTRNLLGLEDRVGPRAHRVRYEDLVRQPEAAMRQIADFLSIAYEDALIEPYSGGRMIDGPGDPDIFQHDDIDASLANRWQSAEQPQALGEETLVLAAKLGYEVPGNAPSTSSTDPTAATHLLDRLDELSDDEVTATLNALLADSSEA